MRQTMGGIDWGCKWERSPKYRKDLHWTICFHWSAQYSIEIALRWAIRQESGPKCTQEIALSWTIRLRIRLLAIASRPGWCPQKFHQVCFPTYRAGLVVMMTIKMLTKRICIVVVVDTMCSLPFSLKPFVDLGLHPYTLLYPGMRCRKQRTPTLLCHKHTWPMLLCRKHTWAGFVEHPKPWSISCDPQDAEHPNIDMWARAFRNI